MAKPPIEYRPGGRVAGAPKIAKAAPPVKVVVGPLPPPDALTEQLTAQFTRNVAVATGRGEPDPWAGCPHCAARRAADKARQDRHRAKGSPK